MHKHQGASCDMPATAVLLACCRGAVTSYPISLCYAHVVYRHVVEVLLGVVVVPRTRTLSLCAHYLPMLACSPHAAQPCILSYSHPRMLSYSCAPLPSRPAAFRLVLSDAFTHTHALSLSLSEMCKGRKCQEGVTHGCGGQVHGLPGRGAPKLPALGLLQRLARVPRTPEGGAGRGRGC